MASTPTSLLRERTVVDCDTLDVNVAQELGPFQDCTSNQAIAFNELQDPLHKDLVMNAVTSAKTLCKSDFPRMTPAELAVELSVFPTVTYLHRASFTDRQDGQPIAADVQIYQRLHPCSNKPSLLLLHSKDPG